MGLRPGGRCGADPRGDRAGPAPAATGADRVRGDGLGGPPAPGVAGPERHGGAHRHRRLRHRLLQPRLPQPAAGLRAEAGRFLRPRLPVRGDAQGGAAEPRRRGDRGGDDPAGPPARPDGHRRVRGDRGAGEQTAPDRLRHRTGLAVLPPGAAGPHLRAAGRPQLRRGKAVTGPTPRAVHRRRRSTRRSAGAVRRGGRGW
ncbi:hypothetical protein SGPA1_30195 [Streptomyces misionensis JCM 4497]